MGTVIDGAQLEKIESKETEGSDWAKLALVLVSGGDEKAGNGSSRASGGVEGAETWSTCMAVLLGEEKEGSSEEVVENVDIQRWKGF